MNDLLRLHDDCSSPLLPPLRRSRPFIRRDTVWFLSPHTRTLILRTLLTAWRTVGSRHMSDLVLGWARPAGCLHVLGLLAGTVAWGPCESVVV